MHKILLAAAAFTGLLTLTSLNASAAPFSGMAGVHVTPANGHVTNVYYEWHHHYWHHRRWYHGCWHYWD
jgi:hypothetical protein